MGVLRAGVKGGEGGRGGMNNGTYYFQLRICIGTVESRLSGIIMGSVITLIKYLDYLSQGT